MSKEMRSQVDNLVEKMSEADSLMNAGVDAFSASKVAFSAGPSITLAKAFKDQIELVNNSVNITLDSMLDVLKPFGIEMLVRALASTKIMNGNTYQECFYFRDVFDRTIGKCVGFTDTLNQNREVTVLTKIPLNSKIQLIEAIENILNSYKF